MNERNPSHKDPQRPVGIPVLFGIGATAGFIAAVSPRLLAVLAVRGSEGDVTLFTVGFFLAAAAFAIVIGVSMIWLYQGTTENTRNLFMAALALPSVLSGGTNMANATSGALADLQKTSRQIEDIAHAFDIKPEQPTTLEPRGSPLGVVAAYTANGTCDLHSYTGGGGIDLNPSVRYQLPRDYVVVLDSARSEVEIKQKLDAQKGKRGLADLTILKCGNNYYLTRGTLMTRSDALLEAIRTKQDLGLKPRVLQVR